MKQRFAALSVAAHALVAVALLVPLTFGSAKPPPVQWAKVELVQQPTPTVGSGARESGTGQQEEAQAPPPIPPTAADIPPTLAESPPMATSAPPVPTPPPPPQQTAANAVPMPPPVPPASAPAPHPAPKPVRTPPPSPPRPPTDQQADQAAEPPPAIRLGDGGTLGTALVSGDNIIPARTDSRIRNQQPVYPEESARRGEEGSVILMVHIKPDGSAATVDVQTSSGYERLDRAAHDAVSRWHFQPAQQNGLPVASEMPVQVRFVMKD